MCRSTSSKEVLTSEVKIGFPDPFLSGMPDVPIKVGDSVDALTEAMRTQLTRQKDNSKVTDILRHSQFH